MRLQQCHRCLACAATRQAPGACRLYGSETEARLLQGELDELEREEFFRLKKVQDKKQRDVDKRKADEAAAFKAAAANAPAGAAAATGRTAAVNLLMTMDDDELF